MDLRAVVEKEIIAVHRNRLDIGQVISIKAQSRVLEATDYSP
jgi:hypothetical protein